VNTNAPAPSTAASQTTPTTNAAGTPAEITIDDLAKIDLRIGQVLAAERVEGSDKLLKLTVDLGSEQRTIFSGIQNAYTPEQMLNRYVVVVANLKPRKMRFGLSQGMVLAASGEGDGVYLVSPDLGGTAGMQVK
jgi:methionyl-tRNA synthetase